MSQNPRYETPNEDPALGPIDPECSFAESMGSFVDEARQIVVDLGLRPYRVFSVVVRWDGGAVGRGTPRVESEEEFLPTPKLEETSGVRGEMRSGGLVERGSVRLREISPRYTEDQVRLLAHSNPLPQALQGWIEVRVDARDGRTERRRFIVSGMPYRAAESFEWRANLLRQDEDRTRSGLVGP